MGPERWSEIRSTAIHEGAHAAVAFVLHSDFRKVSIIPDEGSAGRTHLTDPPKWFKPETEVTKRSRGFIEKRIMIQLAGFEAEDLWSRQVRGRPRDWRAKLDLGAQTDREIAVDLASYVEAGPGEGDLYLKRLQPRARDLLGRLVPPPEGTGSPPLAVPTFIEGRAWPLVLAVADELGRSGELTWRQARRVMELAEQA